MATPESVRRSPRSGPGSQTQADLGMTSADWYELRTALANVFDNDRSAADILGRIGFPAGLRPQDWSGNSEQAWVQVFELLEKGLIQFPQRNLLYAAFRTYQYNEMFRALAIRYELIPPDDEAAEASEAAAADEPAVPQASAAGSRDTTHRRRRRPSRPRARPAGSSAMRKSRRRPVTSSCGRARRRIVRPPPRSWPT